MTHAPLSADDPRLTAYVLDELTPAERAEVDLLLAASPESRATVEEIRDLSTELFTSLQAELPLPRRATASPWPLPSKPAAASPNGATMLLSQNRLSRPPVQRGATAGSWGIAAIATGVLLMLGFSLLRAPSNDGVEPQPLGHVAADGSYHLALSDFVLRWEAEQQQEWELFLTSLTPEEREQLTRDISGDTSGLVVAGDDVSQSAPSISSGSEQLSALSDISSGPAPTASPALTWEKLVERRRKWNSVDLSQPVETDATPSVALGNSKLPNYAWPANGPNANSAQIPYPSDYNSSLHSYMGPSFPHPQVSLGWRSANLEQEFSAPDGYAQTRPVAISGRVLNEAGEKKYWVPRFGWEGLQRRSTLPDGRMAPGAHHSSFDAGIEQQSFLSYQRSQGMDGIAPGLAFLPQRIRWNDGGWNWRPDVHGDHIQIAADYQTGESYRPITENNFIVPTGETALSTFGLDVDTASYSNTRRFLNGGQLPPVDAVRLEELVNYFSYDNTPPEAGEPFAVTREVTPCPWNPKHQLVRIGLKGKEIPLDQRPLTRLVFLLDTSGSMQSENKLPLVQQSMRLLTKQLGENDRIAIVTYAGSAELKLDSTAGDDHEAILAAIESLSANGSTNGEGGIKLAYDIARKHFIDNGTNRVILCTDGDFNVGVSDDGELVKLIEEQRESGVFLTILGFGMGNIKDAKLEGLADKGNGSYGYVDTIEEATKLFVEELMGTLHTIAKDVKLQIEFNPKHVGAYRLLGYENRLLAAEDFNNDKIDAGELGAGHSVTALYEIVPPDAWQRRPFVDPLRYQPLQQHDRGTKTNPTTSAKLTNRDLAERISATLTAEKLHNYDIEIRVKEGNVTLILNGAAADQAVLRAAEAAARSIPGVRSIRSTLLVDGKRQEVEQLVEGAVAMPAPPVTTAPDATVQTEELLLVKVRYKQPDGTTSVKREWALKNVVSPPSKSMQWASAVVGFGLLLRNSAHREEANWPLVLELAQGAQNDATFSQKERERRAEFVTLCGLAQPLWQKAHTPPAPPQLVQGTITDVLGKELVEINLGTAAGIVTGETLSMLRRGEGEEPVWLGTVEIVSVEEGKSFGKASIAATELKGTSVLKFTPPQP